MKRPVLLVMFFCLFSSASRSEVEITINDTQFLYDGPVRLAQVLTPVAFQEKWYWQSAQLFAFSKASTEQLEQQRIDLIHALQAQSLVNNDISETYLTIADQVNTWYLADRISLNIDYDLARISLEHNPQFVSGKHLLLLTPRPSTLHIFGALPKAETIEYPENTCIADILEGVELLEGAERNIVYIISLSGNVQQAPIAYWNKSCVMAPPGASIYIPLLENQWSASARNLNELVIELAINRITRQ